jgi:hypothetical protein
MTCPPSCIHYGTTCYAENFRTAANWRKADTGITLAELCDKISDLPRYQLWRYAVAGDLPGQGEAVDSEALTLMAAANYGKMGFGFTHKHSDEALQAARKSTAAGFVINISADGLADLDKLHARGAWPLVVTLPSDSPKRLTSPGGLPVAICPAQVMDTSCAKCKLCARADRKVVVGFLAHGNRKVRLDGRLRSLVEGV